VSLAFPAPVDQLFTATELNEWAWCSAVHRRDPARWARVTDALLEDYLADARDPADVIPPVLEETAALDRLARRAASEKRPELNSLLSAARTHRVDALLDDETLTLGTGTGATIWPLNALPAPDAVPWPDLHSIPVAVVTGSNGKTTTVRLIAACLRAAGRRDGYTCTDGVFVDGDAVATGDYSGPAGARLVLRDPRVAAAVLETARGGMLRRGFALERAQVAIVTNVSADHFGEYGIDDLDALADVKLTVAHLLHDDGLLVLNADDALLVAKAASLEVRFGRKPTLGWFARDLATATRVAQWLSPGEPTCGVEDGHLRLHAAAATHDLGDVRALPLTVDGTALYNVENLAGAALVAWRLGIEPATIREVFGAFGRNPTDNPGRLMRYDRDGVRIVVDYAHNPDGLRGILGVAQTLRAPGGRLAMLLGHAGNRLDEDIAGLARVAVEFAPDLVVVKEDEGHLRGRQPGEVPAILRRALLQSGLAADAAPIEPSEVGAATHALRWARSGDVVVLLLHDPGARRKMLEILDK
jgi:UDP-N-acetylmuramyl tripeptide synthase